MFLKEELEVLFLLRKVLGKVFGDVVNIIEGMIYGEIYNEGFMLYMIVVVNIYDVDLGIVLKDVCNVIVFLGEFLKGLNVEVIGLVFVLEEM